MLEEIADSRCPIDPGIMGVLVDFRVAGLSTYGSCQGHLGRGLPYPWVAFGVRSDSPEGNAGLYAEVGRLLEEFYDVGDVPGARLILVPIGNCGVFRLRVAEGPFATAVPAYLRYNRDEMKRFSAFARSRRES